MNKYIASHSILSSVRSSHIVYLAPVDGKNCLYLRNYDLWPLEKFIPTNWLGHSRGLAPGTDNTWASYTLRRIHVETAVWDRKRRQLPGLKWAAASRWKEQISEEGHKRRKNEVKKGSPWFSSFLFYDTWFWIGLTKAKPGTPKQSVEDDGRAK